MEEGDGVEMMSEGALMDSNMAGGVNALRGTRVAGISPDCVNIQEGCGVDTGTSVWYAASKRKKIASVFSRSVIQSPPVVWRIRASWGHTRSHVVVGTSGNAAIWADFGSMATSRSGTGGGDGALGGASCSYVVPCLSDAQLICGCGCRSSRRLWLLGEAKLLTGANHDEQLAASSKGVVVNFLAGRVGTERITAG